MKIPVRRTSAVLEALALETGVYVAIEVGESPVTGCTMLQMGTDWFGLVWFGLPVAR